jgi:hypothetical protein
MRNISDEICREKSKRKSYIQKPFPENRAVYEIMWKNIVEPGRSHDNMARARRRLYA